FVATPLPVPPPQGGREPCGAHLRNSRNVPAGPLPHLRPWLSACLERTERVLAPRRRQDEARIHDRSRHQTRRPRLPPSLPVLALLAQALSRARRRRCLHCVAGGRGRR